MTRRNKYGNKKCKFDGISFDSKRELKRYHELKEMEKQGLIKMLLVHQRYYFMDALIKGDKRDTRPSYTADFSYQMNGKWVIEDVKSSFTAKDKYFKFKRAIFERDFKQEITVII